MTLDNQPQSLIADTFDGFCCVKLQDDIRKGLIDCSIEADKTGNLVFKFIKYNGKAHACCKYCYRRDSQMKLSLSKRLVKMLGLDKKEDNRGQDA